MKNVLLLKVKEKYPALTGGNFYIHGVEANYVSQASCLGALAEDMLSRQDVSLPIGISKEYILYGQDA